MMRRVTALALAAALVGGLFAIPAAPSGAQNGDSMLDAPRLGFEIDPKAGNVGDTVAAQVDPDDVQEHCITEYGQLQALFGDADDPNFSSGNAFRTPGPVFADYMNLGPLIDIQPPADGAWPAVDPNIPGFPIPPVPQPPSPAWVDPQYWAWQVTGMGSLVPSEPWLLDTPERAAAKALWYFFGLLATPTTGGGVSGEAQTAVLEAINIVTFVDPVTQELVGEMGGFDPDTGVGQVDVPDLDPGLWAVAAACVEPVVTEESFMAAMAAGAEAVIEAGWELPVSGGFASTAGAEAVVPSMLAELMAPRALGLDFYCILNEDGFCATPPDPVGLLAELTDEELAEFADLQAGDDTGTGGGAGDAGAEVVVASPAFTG